MSALAQVLLERYRCPEAFVPLELKDGLSENVGFFRFGPGVTCYGRTSAGYRKARVEPVLYDIAQDITLYPSAVYLPFDPSEIVTNLRLERYASGQDSMTRRVCKHAYYSMRPILPRPVRTEIQKLQLNLWKAQRSPFPSWPVDRTIENICEKLMSLALQSTGAGRIPFIWFWPDGARSCAIMTHDVDSERGKQFCGDLMNIDDSVGIKASFQIVPERCYSITSQFLATIRNRGFEICIHDLDHDGRLFNDRDQFLKRAKGINHYAKLYKAKGFRAAVLYRNPDWYDALDFSFDMSIPNTAHLDPQWGGCCTVMPYFIGDILELPLTTTQDYMLFYLLEEHSIKLWKNQIDLILDKNGLVSFIVHPDYVMADKVLPLYKCLLGYLRELKVSGDMWVTIPSEVDQWWRARSKMKLTPRGNEWCIEGEGAERALVAYARNTNGRVVYEVEPNRAAVEPRRAN